MREYACVSPRFWTGETGRKIRTGDDARAAVIVALYLQTSPHANMLGLYYQPIAFITHETPLDVEGASKGLQRCIEVGFCSYDYTTECVFVHEMAAWQVADQLKANDKRVPNIQKAFDLLPKTALLREFFIRYQASFHLRNTRGIEAPSKPGAGTGDGTGTGDEETAALTLEGGSAPDVEITLPYIGGQLAITKADIQFWKESYPLVPDVHQSLRNLKAWLQADKTRYSAKPASTRTRVTNWLKGDNDQAAKRGGPKPGGKRNYRDTGDMRQAGK